MYFIGYALAYFSEPKHRKNLNQNKKQSPQTSNPEIEIGVLVPEEPPIITQQSKTKNDNA